MLNHGFQPRYSTTILQPRYWVWWQKYPKFTYFALLYFTSFVTGSDFDKSWWKFVRVWRVMDIKGGCIKLVTTFELPVSELNGRKCAFLIGQAIALTKVSFNYVFIQPVPGADLLSSTLILFWLAHESCANSRFSTLILVWPAFSWNRPIDVWKAFRNFEFSFHLELTIYCVFI
jgi:hypothetical protein